MVGGHLTPEWLTDAYRHGIFPWPVFEDEHLLAWWSPDPRGVIPLDGSQSGSQGGSQGGSQSGLHVSRRLRRVVKSGKFQVTINRDFSGVIRACASVDDRRDNTWITCAMREAYETYHREGKAHSIEVWHEGELAGGVYGVGLGGMFAGESMFHHVTDASKVALVHLVDHLKHRGYRLFDIQQRTGHSASMGAVDISRSQYLARLQAAVSLRVTFGETLEPA